MHSLRAFELRFSTKELNRDARLVLFVIAVSRSDALPVSRKKFPM